MRCFMHEGCLQVFRNVIDSCATDIVRGGCLLPLLLEQIVDTDEIRLIATHNLGVLQISIICSI